MNAPGPTFDRLARVYEGLERLAFGGALEAARFGLLDRLAGCRRVLVPGEDDGRFLARLLRRLPEVEVTCVERSEAMIRRARLRLTCADVARVRWHQLDARELGSEIGEHDAAVTLFFLDCFTSVEAAEVVDRVARALRPEARWLWADFAVPAAGWRRLRARVWVGGLYRFFQWRTGLAVDRLPPAEALIRGAGFEVCAEQTRQAGLLRSVLFTRGR